MVQAPMGWGKTSYLMHYLVKRLKEDGLSRVFITMPNVAVAKDVLKTIRDCESKMGNKNKVGFNIAKIHEDGDIIVQTPGYLEEGFNIVDEFQMLTHFNKSFFEDKQNWRNLILMSATPEVPLLAAAQEAGIKIRMIKRESLRTEKRFLIWGPVKCCPERISPNMIVFSSRNPE